MERILLLKLAFSFFVVAGILFFGESVFAACREVTCAASCGSQEIEVTNACKTEMNCTQKACIPQSFVSSCPNFNTQCAVSCTGDDDPACTNVACPTGTKYCKTGNAADPCASGGTGTCEVPVSLACPDGRQYLGASRTCVNLGSNPAKICCQKSSSACTGGNCKAACATGETEDATCSTSQCASQPTNKKYCKAGGGDSGTTPVKCDPAKFREYAGVCFPLNTGLSEMSVTKIILNLMKWLLYLFGFLAIIAFVISGIQYLSAAGNMNMIETAKRNMTWSIVGVVVALSGLVILTAIDALLRATAWGG